MNQLLENSDLTPLTPNTISDIDLLKEASKEITEQLYRSWEF